MLSPTQLQLAITNHAGLAGWHRSNPTDPTQDKGLHITKNIDVRVVRSSIHSNRFDDTTSPETSEH